MKKSAPVWLPSPASAQWAAAQAQAAAEDYCRVQFSDPAPEPVRLAVLLMVSHFYENRDNPDRQVYLTMRMAFQNLLYPYRDPMKMF